MSFIEKLIIAAIFIMSAAVAYSTFGPCAHAAFGGARGGGVSMGRSSSSSFGGSRGSMGGRVTISRPAVRAVPVETHTTVIHSSDGGYHPGFFSGMLMGHMMSQPQVVVAGAPAIAGPRYERDGVGWGDIIFFVLLGGLCTVMLWMALRRI